VHRVVAVARSGFRFSYASALRRAIRTAHRAECRALHAGGRQLGVGSSPPRLHGALSFVATECGQKLAHSGYQAQLRVRNRGQHCLVLHLDILCVLLFILFASVAARSVRRNVISSLMYSFISFILVYKASFPIGFVVVYLFFVVHRNGGARRELSRAHRVVLVARAFHAAHIDECRQ
jgi:hypothetical protein